MIIVEYILGLILGIIAIVKGYKYRKKPVGIIVMVVGILISVYITFILLLAVSLFYTENT